MEGCVWRTNVPSAVKVFYLPDKFETELSCYERLKSYGVNQIFGHNVPVLEGYDRELRVIEITFVQSPYLLDFGKATLDHPPRYLQDESDLRRIQSQHVSEFGDRWPQVNALLHTLETKYGIFYLDARRANISFGDEHDTDNDDWMNEPLIDYSDYE